MLLCYLVLCLLCCFVVIDVTWFVTWDLFAYVLVF